MKTTCQRNVLGLGLIALAGLLGGCGNMGLGGSSEFSCKAPPGVSCMSLRGTYENYERGNLPFQKTGTQEGESADGDRAGAEPASQDGREGNGKTSGRAQVVEPPHSGMPIRRDPSILRAWIAPRKNEFGDWEGAQHIYIVVDQGDWVMDGVRKELVRDYRAVTTPLAAPRPVRAASPAAEDENHDAQPHPDARPRSESPLGKVSAGK